MAKRRTPGGASSQKKNDKAPIAARAREVADAIAALPDQLKAMFTAGESQKVRRDRIRSLTNEIGVGMLPVVNFIERRRPAETASLFLRRIDYLLVEMQKLAGLDIPEWQAEGRPKYPPSTTLRRAGELCVVAMLNSDLIHGWADDIEAEESPKTQTSPTEPRKRGRKSKYDPKADERIWDAWQKYWGTGTYADLGKRLGITGDQVKQAIDRHRQRVKARPSRRKRR